MASSDPRFVADAHERLRAEAEHRIRREVLREHAAALRRAGFWRRSWLWIVIRRAIAERLAEQLPLRALQSHEPASSRSHGPRRDVLRGRVG